VISLEKILAAVLMLMFISACSRGFGAAVDSDRAASSEKARSASAETMGSEKISLEGIRLKRDGSLSPDSAPILDAAAEILRNKPTSKYYVETYCGGSARKLSSQIRLSQARAAAVTAYLEAYGISSNRLIVHGCHTVDVVASNRTKRALHGSTANHRVELVQVD